MAHVANISLNISNKANFFTEIFFETNMERRTHWIDLDGLRPKWFIYIKMTISWRVDSWKTVDEKLSLISYDQYIIMTLLELLKTKTKLDSVPCSVLIYSFHMRRTSVLLITAHPKCSEEKFFIPSEIFYPIDLRSYERHKTPG